MFFFDEGHLAAVAAEQQGFAEAEPFPHVVIDTLLPEPLLKTVAAEFPQPSGAAWAEHLSTTSRYKYTNDRHWTMGLAARQVLGELNSGLFLRFLTTITGIDGLIADPYLEGGGMHQIARGGFLKMHADFNVHPTLRLDRRLNLLVYLNEGWQDEWGGHLELWDRDMTRCVRKIAPEIGRVVIFSTTDWSNHGHPDPLRTPRGVTRKSLALYYYTAGRPESEAPDEHSTLYRSRPGEEVTSSPQPLSDSILARMERRIRRS